MSLLFEFFISVEPLLGFLIKCLQVGNVWRVLDEVREVLVQFLNQHSKLSTPISNVVDSPDIMAQILEDSADAIALDG